MSGLMLAILFLGMAAGGRAEEMAPSTSRGGSPCFTA
jgi:hypothetical protein